MRSKRAPEPALLALLAGWLLLSIACIWLRPLWPVDETRYASVAWEMWLRGDFLVPHVNGEAYSHKPPLLFWLIHLGWAVFGVNEWWPRMVAPLCALGAVPLTLKLGRLLWPQERAAHDAALWVLFGTLLFAGFITLTMFDLLLLLCTLAGMIGVVLLSQGARAQGLLWLGAGIGFGVLTKGPVILLHVLPAAAVAPWWWAPQLKGRVGRWYLDLLLGVLLGAALALAWALPAAYFGGEEYRHAIFWGQTAGRVAESFAHRAPFWYYLPFLPLILFPWFVWPRFWKGILELRKEPQQNATRFLMAWLLLTLLGFSLVSGKQAKYLVPFVPAFALLAGYALTRVPSPGRWWEMLLPALGFVGAAGFFAALRANPAVLKLPEWVGEVPLWPIVLLAALAPVLLAVGRKAVPMQMRALAFALLAAFAIGVGGIIPAFVPYGDPAPAARHLAALQAREVPLAHFGKYHATYNFVGRLRRPIDIIDYRELGDWVRAHPEGRVILVERANSRGRAEYETRFRGAWLQVWDGARLFAERPDLWKPRPETPLD